MTSTVILSFLVDSPEGLGIFPGHLRLCLLFPYIILVKHVALHCLCMTFLHLTAPSTQLSNQNCKANQEGERKSNTEKGTNGKPKVSIEK